MIKAIVFDCFGVLWGGESPSDKLIDYVRELKSSGYKMAIVSNTSQGVLSRLFDSDTLGLFNTVVASVEAGYAKPAAEIYQLAIEQLGVEPTSCVFVDDNQDYCTAAEKVGMKSIWYRDFVQLKHDLGDILSRG